MVSVNKPLVSVVIPLFNKEKYIKATLESVVNQTYSEIELVIVDDSSTDRSYELAQDYLQPYLNRFRDITLRSRKNTGQAGARNDGVLEAKGEFIAFLDADDIWHPEKIDKQVQFLVENQDQNLVFCNYLMVFENSPKVKAVKLTPIHKKVVSWLLTVGYGGLLESTGMARKSSFLEMGGFDSNLQMCGGLDLAYRYKHRNGIGCVNEYLCGYRVTKDGWHNNKSDLVQSYELLLAKTDLYREYETKASKYLRIHLCIWSLRNSFTLLNASALFVEFVRNPIAFSSYVLATTSRVFLATLRGATLREDSRIMRGLMS